MPGVCRPGDSQGGASHPTIFASIVSIGILIYMGNDLPTNSDTNNDPSTEFNALQTVIAALQPLAPSTRQRIFDAAATFLRIEFTFRDESMPRASTPPRASVPAFSDDTAMSPKEFILEKQPRTDVERIACLGYYLTHYRDTPHFKTLDLSKLNTEAAQPKFSNAANSTSNAVKMGYLVPSTKGQKQLSASGEQFVRMLPERNAARAAMAATRPRRRRKRAQSNGNAQGE